MSLRPLSERVEERIRVWGLVVEGFFETESSFVAFGLRGSLPVVLKVIRRPCDEWLCGEVLEAFGGRGIVRVYEYVEGAVLLERLNPGTPLSAMSLEGRDEEATRILAEVMRSMSEPFTSSREFVTVQEWGEGFRRYLASGDEQIPAALVEQGQHLYLRLCASQQGARLLHGDLHHYNVLFDSDRGWLAVDPKGVVGEIEYEIGAALRNPYERPEMFATPETVVRRLGCYEAELKIDPERALAWGFAQAVLSAVWSVEDGDAVDARNPALMLARVIGQLLG
jgi:streptomycin 6-kinase